MHEQKQRRLKIKLGMHSRTNTERASSEEDYTADADDGLDRQHSTASMRPESVYDDAVSIHTTGDSSLRYGYGSGGSRTPSEASQDIGDAEWQARQQHAPTEVVVGGDAGWAEEDMERGPGRADTGDFMSEVLLPSPTAGIRAPEPSLTNLVDRPGTAICNLNAIFFTETPQFTLIVR